MTLTIRLIFIFVILFNTHNIYGKTSTDLQGHGVYNLETCMSKGSIEWWSQIDPTGQIVFLFKSIKKNTSVDFVKISQFLDPKTKQPETVIVLLIKVKAEDPICASMTEIQELKIALNPLPVNEISLSGKTVSENKKIRVLTL